MMEWLKKAVVLKKMKKKTIFVVVEVAHEPIDHPELLAH